jgi:hypothetical protein
VWPTREIGIDKMETAGMTSSTKRFQRRQFLKLGSLAVASVAITMRAAQFALAAQPHLEESDATAQSLGYKHDAATADKAKFPKYKAGEACASCQLYQGKAGDAWGGCPIFAGKDVNAKGWCSAYVKKA